MRFLLGIVSGLALCLVLYMALLVGPTLLDPRAPAPPGPLVEERLPSMGPRPQSYEYYPPPDRFESYTAADGTTVRYYEGRFAGTAPPVVVLLHGSERDGRSMLDMWQDAADRHGLVLMAPDSRDPARWNLRREGGPWLEGLAQELRARLRIAPGPMHLYGHSAGAVAALGIAARDDGGWQSVAVHAGTVPGRRIRPSPGALPILIQIGEEDHLFPLELVRESARGLSGAGHPVTLRIVAGHDHWFYAVGDKLAENAWTFMAATDGEG